jgi:hypothetical protein
MYMRARLTVVSINNSCWLDCHVTLSKSHETISSKREEILKVVSPAKRRDKEEKRREINNVLEL